MDLEGVEVVQRQFIRRAVKISAELRNRANVGSLRRRRHVADGHVLDHAATKRAYLGHLGNSCLRVGCNPSSSQTGDRSRHQAAPAAVAASFNPKTLDASKKFQKC